MSGVAYLNKVWIIESLPDGDLKTGTRLFEYLRDRAGPVQTELPVSLVKPQSKEQLVEVLHDVYADAAGGCHPMLHFECHGSNEGLAVANGDVVAWKDLEPILIDINRACRMNLVLVLAACNGVWLIETAKRMSFAPFWSVIGQEHEVSAGSIATDFKAFYTEFFVSLDGDAAIRALNMGSERKRTYHFVSAAGLFCRAYREYHRKFCAVRAVKQQRVESLTSAAMKLPGPRALGVAWVRDYVKNSLKDGELHFNNIKKRYFFIDVYPDNAKRFPFTFDEVVNGELP